MQLTEQQWNEYSRTGYLRLGKILDQHSIDALRQRADDLASGNIHNPAVQMQLDTGGAYEQLPEAHHDFVPDGLLYRKIQGLEMDDLFSPLVRHPLFAEICAHEYGAHASTSIFRAMIMNKPAGQGTLLPWHQDGGEVWALDRDPLITIWLALDPATVENGCIEIISGSHRLGLLSTHGSTISEEDVTRYCQADKIEAIEVEAGHCLLMHNWLLHRSGLNPTSQPRRAFTACYLDGRTQSVLTGNYFPFVQGEAPTESYPFVRQLQIDNAFLRDTAAKSEEYALSLLEVNTSLQRSQTDMQQHVHKLDEAIHQLRAGFDPRKSIVNWLRKLIR
jgi:ectoine hydroxylase-related dioxygenase (phytanoyl-CoA dioxygenase family)